MDGGGAACADIGEGLVGMVVIFGGGVGKL